MKREQLSDIIGNIDDWQIAEAYQFDPTLCNRSPERTVHMNKNTKIRKRVISLPLAAVLILLLGATAFAVGRSIHEKAQAELREQLKIEENAVTDYVETVLPEAENTRADGVALLSTVNDGEFQRVYVNISPVDPEIARSIEKAEIKEDGSYSYYSFGFTEDGNHFGIATPAVLINVDDSVSMDDIINAAYDEETQTFTMECACMNSMHSDDEPFELTVVLHWITKKANEDVYDAEPIQTFGTITVYPTANTVRSIRFETPYAFENAVTGGKGEIIGVDLSSFNVDILVTHENMETMYTPNTELEGDTKAAHLEEQLGWLQAEDELAQSMILTFSDGSSRAGFGVMSSPCENGMLVLHCGPGNRSININEVVCISIGNQTVWESNG